MYSALAVFRALYMYRSVYPHNNPMLRVLLLPPYYRRGHWVTDEVIEVTCWRHAARRPRRVWRAWFRGSLFHVIVHWRNRDILSCVTPPAGEHNFDIFSRLISQFNVRLFLKITVCRIASETHCHCAQITFQTWSPIVHPGMMGKPLSSTLTFCLCRSWKQCCHIFFLAEEICRPR